MKVSVFGLGYVGCVTATCLSRDGHDVVGVDVNPVKVGQVSSGTSPIIEPGLDELMRSMVDGGRLEATMDGETAVRKTDLSLICVGTPSNGNGSLDLQHVEKVCREVGHALASKPGYHVVVLRSTVLPGTMEESLLPILESASGKHAGSGFGVCMNPEFMREGKAIDDYYHPSHIVIGQLDERSGSQVERLYGSVEAPVVRTAIRTAEAVKYVANAFHALKIAFANEVAAFCEELDIDAQEVMELFVQDRRLNISPVYLRPGFAFGGSCLPKDLRALLYRTRELDLDTPLLGSVLTSNQKQIERAIRSVEKTGCKKVGVLGLAFKAGTDDVRESPTVPLIETLIGRGYQVLVYDDKVDPKRLVGANRLYLERELPHIASIMRPSVRDVIKDSEVIVVANASPAFRHVTRMMNPRQLLVDLVGIVSGDGKEVSHDRVA